ncbi:MAG: transposase [Methylobacteriaceae bacterium]|nr:transposase [Methylobacteriaceae bacterium]
MSDDAASSRARLVERWRRAMEDGLSASQAARAVGVSRATLYRWKERPSLRSRRPHHVRQRQWSAALIRAVERLRRDYPMWGRAKLGPLVRAEGFTASDMTVGRIIAHLVRRGAAEPVPVARRAAKTRRWTARRRHAVRLPKGLKPDIPGGIVQLDTVYVQVGPQSHIKHFTAYDPVAKWTVGQAFRRATAHAASLFLDKMLADMPFRIEAIQVDGGSEFKAEFEQACKNKGLILYELPPKSPKLNAGVERCNAAWRYEFYATFDLPTQVDQINPLIDCFQHLYNHHRPHGALGGQTPASYLSARTKGAIPSQMS